MRRPLFWLGLLAGALTAFGARRFARRAPMLPDPLLDMTEDALIACSPEGAVTRVNGAAQRVFGPEAEGLARLCYPSGQPVPPGQRPPLGVLRGAALNAALYRHDAADGTRRVLEASARLLPTGGTLAVFRDVTAREDSRARSTEAARRQGVLHEISRRLGTAPDSAPSARTLVEGARLLLGGPPEVRARLYAHDPAAQTLTRLASDPEDHPKRPRSLAQSQKAAFPFDAAIPLLWQLYVARQPSAHPALGEEAAGSAYALPLLSGGLTRGHLSLTSSTPGALDDPDVHEALAILAALAAPALSLPAVKVPKASRPAGRTAG